MQVSNTNFSVSFRVRSSRSANQRSIVPLCSSGPIPPCSSGPIAPCSSGPISLPCMKTNGDTVTKHRKSASVRELAGGGSIESVTLPLSYVKRASEFHQKLTYKNDPVMRAAVGIHQFLRVIKSPTTKKTLPSVCASHPSFLPSLRALLNRSGGKELLLKKRLQRDLRLIVRMRCRKQFEGVRGIRDLWTEDKISMRKVGRITHTPLSTLRWYFSEPAGDARTVSVDDSTAVLKYFSRSDVSMQLPHKRYAKLRFLREPFHLLYKRYAAQQIALKRRALKPTAVHKILPKKTFRKVGKIPFQNCKCNRCENFTLALGSALGHGIKGLATDLTGNCLDSMCKQHHSIEPSRKIYGPNRVCLLRKCSACSNKFSSLITEKNKAVDMSVEIEYRQWGHKYYANAQGTRIKGPYKNNVFMGTKADLAGLMKLQMQELPLHMFHYNWQGEQLEIAKANLRPSELLVIVDFAKNITLPRQHEVQHGFFHRQNVTLHPVVMYYLCLKGQLCQSLVTDEFMCISGDTKHDAYAVHTYIKIALEHLSKQGTKVTRLIVFSDNCSVQYKSKLPFELMQMYGFPTEHHYFGAGHGKSAADGLVGRIKRMIDQAVRSGSARIQDALDLALWCQRHASSKVKMQLGVDECVHYQRQFKYVSEIDRSFEGTYPTLKGTMKLHSIKTTATSGELLCRDTSCLCRLRFLL